MVMAGRRPGPPESEETMKRVLILSVFFALVTPAARAGMPTWALKNVPAADRPIVIKAWDVAERECPSLRELDWKALQQAMPNFQAVSIGISPADDPWLANAPFKSGYGWTKVLGVAIDQGGAGRMISFEMGAGSRPGIASRSGGGFAGAAMCGLTEKTGDYSFREVDDLRLLDALK
jgi:hypothetical protein